MRRASILLAAALAAACAKRVAPSAGEDRTVGSGVPVSFGEKQDLPEGTTIAWSFGDGTPTQQGPAVVHAFPRAGNFTVTQTIRDQGGVEQTATAHITVLRRGVPMAVPAEVRGVLIAERPWNRAKLTREVAHRIGLGTFFEETRSAVGEALGFDPTDAAEVAANGLDPDEGVALYTVPQDEEAVVLCVGVADEARADAALRNLLARGESDPFQISEARLPSGERISIGSRLAGAQRIAWLFRFGYLYLRTRGRTDPAIALVSAAAVPEPGGLLRDPTYLATVPHVGTGDAVFYSAPPRPGSEGARRGLLAGQLGASAFAVDLGKDGVQVRLFSQLRNLSGKPLEEVLTPQKPPPDLAALLPAGAAAYLKVSGSPDKVFRELLKALGPEGPSLHDRLNELFGEEPEQTFLASFTGNAGVGVYLDAASFLEAFLGEQVSSLDRSTFLVAAELQPDREVQLRKLLQHAAHDSAPMDVRGAALFRISDALQVALKPGFLFAALGNGAQRDEPAPPAVGRPEPPRKGRGRAPPPAPPEPPAARIGPLGAVLLPHPGQRSLGQELRDAGIRGFDLPQDQMAYLDVQGVLRALERAGDAQGGVVSTGVRLLASRVRGLRDALLEARASPDGLSATATLRFVERIHRKAPGR